MGCCPLFPFSSSSPPPTKKTLLSRFWVAAAPIKSGAVARSWLLRGDWGQGGVQKFGGGQKGGKRGVPGYGGGGEGEGVNGALFKGVWGL